MDLDNLKYSELQKLAKAAGIRANMKVDKLVKALKEHYNQEQSDSDGQKTDTDSSTRLNSAEESHGSSNEDKDDTTKKKPVRGRKKGARGKAKKTSDKSKDEGVETLQAETSQNGSTSSKSPAPKKQTQNTPVLTKTVVSTKTPRSGTPNTSKTPVIVKPVSSKTLQSGTPKIVKPVSAKTPSSGPRNISAKKVVTGKNTPGLFSPKGPVSRPVATSVARVTPGSGKKLASSATKENKKTPVSESSKRRSPRNHDADEKKQQDETGDKTTPGKTGSKRKRQDTFELEGPSLAATATPEAEKTTKRAKRSSGTGQQDSTTPSSPGVQDMIDSMSGEISSAERRRRLMSAINKKVEGKVKSSPNTGPVTQIPRFAAFLAKKKQEQKKPVTPGNKDWEKVHKKEFAKFDSIDVYLEKKRKRADEMTASVKKARTVLHEVQQAVAKLRNKRTPSTGKKSSSQPFKPSVMSTKDMDLNFGAAASKKTTSSRASTAPPNPFRPTVMSTKDMNLTFSTLKTPVNETRAAENKTPASGLKGAQSSRKSVGAGQMSARKSLGASAACKSPNNTPFKFTGNLSMSAAKSASKPVFDLKASLARPITWKPHTGRLKPLQEAHTSKDEKASTTKPTPAAANRMDVFKSMVNRTQRTYSRHDRRVAAAAKRAEQKSNLQMKRRGITVSP